MENIKSLISLLVGHGIKSAVPIFLNFSLLHFLGDDSAGKFMLWLSMGILMISVIDFGFSFSSIRYFSRSEDLIGHINGIYSSKIILIFFGSLLYAIFFILTDKSEYFLFGICSSFFWICASLYPGWYLIGRNNLKNLGQFDIFVNAMGGLAGFIILSLNISPVVIFLSHGTAYIIATLWLIHKYKELNLFKFNLKKGISYMYDNFDVFIGRSGVLIYTSGASALVGNILPHSSFAVYSLSEKIVRGVSSFSTPINQVIYGRSFSNERNTSIFKMFLLSIIFYIAMTLIFCVSVHFFSMYIDLLNKLKNSLYIFSLIIIISGINQFVGMNYLLNKNLDKVYRNILSISGISIICFILLSVRTNHPQTLMLIPIFSEIIVLFCMFTFISITQLKGRRIWKHM